MTSPAGDVVLLCGGPLTAAAASWVERTYRRRAIDVVLLRGERCCPEPPAAWRVHSGASFFDADAFSEDLFAFLEEWPRRPLRGGRSHDDLFRFPDGYSPWWLRPATRQPEKTGRMEALRVLWQCRRALDELQPRLVLVASGDAALLAALVSLAAGRGVAHTVVPGFAAPAPPVWRSGARFLLRSLGQALGLPFALAARSLVARFLAGPGSPAEELSGRPVVVVTTAFPRHFSGPATCPENWYWSGFCRALGAAAPEIGQRLLVYTGKLPFGSAKRRGWLFHSGWKALRARGDLAPLPETFSELRVYLRHLPRQIAFLAANAVLERDAGYRGSFVFAGADVSRYLVPDLRSVIAEMAYFTAAVSGIASALAAAGDVRLLMVNEELYQVGMRHVAAARRLGVPTVGIQHGLITSTHLVYTLPRAQLAGAPTPDRFAAYGEFAAEVLREHGCFPGERVLVAGAPRLDHLVREPRDKAAARRDLGLDAAARVLLVATQHYPWFRDVVDTVCAALRDLSGVVVAIKLHPNDPSLAVYQEIAARQGAANTRFFSDRFDELLAACDVLLSGPSTTVLEAILSGKTTIFANFTGEPDPYPYAAAGGSLRAASPAELGARLGEALAPGAGADPARRKAFLERHLGPTSTGDAARCLAEHVISLVRGEAAAHNPSNGG